MEKPTLLPEYAGGWKLTDESCCQYVRRIAPRTFEMIEYSIVSDVEPMCEVYTDIIHLSDYEEFEILEILAAYGYKSIEDVREKYGGSHDAANQVIAECIFEWYGSFSTEPLAYCVPESLAISLILGHVKTHHDLPALHHRIEVSAEELAARIISLSDSDELLFFSEEDGDCYGAARKSILEVDTVIINYLGGGSPCIIEIEWQGAHAQTHVLHGLKQYFDDSGITSIFVDDL